MEGDELRLIREPHNDLLIVDPLESGISGYVGIGLVQTGDERVQADIILIEIIILTVEDNVLVEDGEIRYCLVEGQFQEYGGCP